MPGIGAPMLTSGRRCPRRGASGPSRCRCATPTIAASAKPAHEPQHRVERVMRQDAGDGEAPERRRDGLERGNSRGGRRRAARRSPRSRRPRGTETRCARSRASAFSDAAAASAGEGVATSAMGDNRAIRRIPTRHVVWCLASHARDTGPVIGRSPIAPHALSIRGAARLSCPHKIREEFMYRATKDIILPTTITGSLPRPSWYTENLGTRHFLEAMVDAPLPRAVRGRADRAICATRSSPASTSSPTATAGSTTTSAARAGPAIRRSTWRASTATTRGRRRPDAAASGSRAATSCTTIWKRG